MNDISKDLDEEEQEKSFLARHKGIILIAAGELTLTGISTVLSTTTGIFSQGMYGALGSVAGTILGSITLPVAGAIALIGMLCIIKAIDYVANKNREEVSKISTTGKNFLANSNGLGKNVINDEHNPFRDLDEANLFEVENVYGDSDKE
jgi:hypothetical protein